MDLSTQDKIAVPTFKSLAEFYPFYLGEHQNITCRRLHLAASLCGIAGVVGAISLHKPSLIVAGAVAGYACAWIGHFGFEKNRPATFKYPLYSFLSDWHLFADMLIGNVSLIDNSLDRK